MKKRYANYRIPLLNCRDNHRQSLWIKGVSLFIRNAFYCKSEVFYLNFKNENVLENKICGIHNKRDRNNRKQSCHRDKLRRVF